MALTETDIKTLSRELIAIPGSTTAPAYTCGFYRQGVNPGCGAPRKTARPDIRPSAPLPDPQRAPQWAARFRALPFPDTVEKMSVYAKAQCELIKDILPGEQPGGRLICAEITRDRMLIGPMCELGNAEGSPEAHRAIVA
jgi:hypothetical protein